MEQTLGTKTGPVGEKMLTDCTGPVGEKYRSKGCCSGSQECQIVRKYVACALTPATEPCAAGSTTVWLCTPPLCDGLAVKWGNRCYTPAIPLEEVPRANLTPSDIVLRPNGGDPAYNYYCLPSCQDPGCTECRTYLRCSPCGDSDPPHGPGQPPPVYINRELVTCCGLVGRYANSLGTIWCFTVDPGADGVREDALPPGTQLATQAPICGLDCCDCGSTCGGRAPVTIRDCATGVETNITCCCPSSYTVEVTYRLNQTVYSVPIASGNYATFTANATFSFTVINGVLQGAPPTIRHTKRDYSNGVLVNTIISDPLAIRPVCGFNPAWALSDSIGLLPVCPVDNLPGSGVQINLAVTQLSCNSGMAQADVAAYFDPASTLPSQTTTFFYSYRITAIDPCGSNCGGVGNALATPAAPVKAVPPEQWPVWAKGIATFRTGDDKGVGDTAERNLGIVGEAFKATAKALGKDCGCAARKAKWNAMFPY